MHVDLPGKVLRPHLSLSGLDVFLPLLDKRATVGQVSDLDRAALLQRRRALLMLILGRRLVLVLPDLIVELVLELRSAVIVDTRAHQRTPIIVTGLYFRAGNRRFGLAQDRVQGDGLLCRDAVDVGVARVVAGSLRLRRVHQAL